MKVDEKEKLIKPIKDIHMICNGRLYHYVVRLCLCVLFTITIGTKFLIAGEIWDVSIPGDNKVDIYKVSANTFFINTLLDDELLGVGGTGLGIDIEVRNYQESGDFYLKIENNDSSWNLKFPNESNYPSNTSITHQIGQAQSTIFNAGFTRIPDAGGNKIFEISLYESKILSDELMETVYIDVTGDADFPVSSITLPTPGSQVSPPVSITWYASDGTSGIHFVDLYMSKDDGPWELINTSTNYTGSYNFNPSIQGIYKFRTYATDNIGQEEDEKGWDTWVWIIIDDDNDGVPNDLDQCPNTPSGTTVNNNGCSKVNISSILSLLLTSDSEKKISVVLT